MAEPVEDSLVQGWIPADWLEPAHRGAIWQSGFHVLRADRDMLASGAKIFGVLESRALLFFGKLRYAEITKQPLSSLESGIFTFSANVGIETPEDVYLLIACPVQGTIQEGEPAARKQVTAAVGLLGLCLGRNLAYEWVFDAVYEVQTNQMQFIGPALENPFHFPPPNLSDEGIATVEEITTSIAKLSENRQARVGLSLQWRDQAMRSNGTDAWLKYWIAIESLVMSQPSDKKNLYETLARSYDVTPEEARRLFGIEELFNFRAHIVHRGRIPDVDGNLLSYMAALHGDILRAHLGLASQQLARAVMQGPGFALNDYLRTGRPKPRH